MVFIFIVVYFSFISLKHFYILDQTTVPIVMNTPLVALSSKMMPVLESLMSPDCPGPLPIIQQRCSTKTVGVSSLTTSTTNYVTSSTVKTVKAKETYRGTNKKDCRSHQLLKLLVIVNNYYR